MKQFEKYIFLKIGFFHPKHEFSILAAFLRQRSTAKAILNVCKKFQDHSLNTFDAV